VPSARQILSDCLAYYYSCSIDKVVLYSKVEFMCCFEIRTSSKNHNFIFTHVICKPVAQSGSPQIVKLGKSLYACSFENQSEPVSEIMNEILS